MRNTKRLENRLKKIKDTKTYLMNQWEEIEAYDKYKDKLTGCCQEVQVHHTLSERLSTNAESVVVYNDYPNAEKNINLVEVINK